MLRTSLFALGFLILQACSSSDGPARHPDDSPDEQPFPTTSSADLTSTLDGVVTAGVAPGVSLTVERPGYTTWSGASGVASLDTGKALAPSDRFRAGSILKTAVATAVLQLIERGDMSLDDDLTKLLPATIAARIPDAASINLRMLLAHTSGIPDFSSAEFEAAVGSDPRHVWTFDELLDRSLSQPPTHAPGAGYAYTNTGYVLLGKVLEKATGEPWRTTVRENVFARAELEHTELPEEGNPACSGCSRGYAASGDALVDITEVDPSMAGPAGGDALVTTPADLAKFLGALEEGRLFDDPGTYDLMRDFGDAPEPDLAQTGYGLGLARFQVGDKELIGNLGGTAGYQGFVFYDPESGTVASGYMNRQGDFGAFVLPVLDAIARVK